MPVPETVVHRNDSGTGFNEPPRHQKILRAHGSGIPAWFRFVACPVPIPGLSGLPRYVQGVEQLRGRQNPHRPLSEDIQTCHSSGSISFTPKLIKCAEQTLPLSKTLRSNSSQDQVVSAGAFRRERRMPQAQESGTRLVVRTMFGRVAQTDEGRGSGASRALVMADDRTEMRPAAGRRISIVVTCHALIRIMGVTSSDHGTDDGDFVHVAGNARQQLADMNSGDSGLRRPEFAPDFFGSVDLDVIHVLVRRAATQVNHDHRLVATPDSGIRFRLQQLRKRHPCQPQRANVQSIPARDTVAKFLMS